MKDSHLLINGHSLKGVHNIYETPVLRLIQELLPEFSRFDGCLICVEDVYALALSRLPATYAHVGSIILNKEVSKENLESVVRYAIIQVIEHPKH